MYSRSEKNSLTTGQAITKQRKPANTATGFKDNRPEAAIQRKMCGVIQRTKEIPTDYGRFFVDKYEKNEQKTGVSIELSFRPNFEPDQLNLVKYIRPGKIGMVQSVRTEDVDGVAEYDPRVRARMAANGYKIDRLASYSVPVYGVEDKNIQNLEHIPDRDSNNSKYKLGNTSFNGAVNAEMEDEPCNYSCADFETTVLVLSGQDKDKYCGSVKWGFENKDCGCCGNSLKIKPVTRASKGDPTSNFTEAAREWNQSKADQMLKLKKLIDVSKVKVYRNTPARRPRNNVTAYVKLSNNQDILIKLKNRMDVNEGRFTKDTVCDLESVQPINQGERLFWHVAARQGGLKGGYCRLSDDLYCACFFVNNNDVDLDDTTGTPNVQLPIV